MGSRLKKAIKNKWVTVNGFYHIDGTRAIEKNFNCCVTNDEIGKTLSIVIGACMVTIPFEQLEQYLR